MTNTTVQYAETSDQGIRLTTAASQRILNYLTEHQHHHLRLSVKKTGCSGLSYVLDYVEAPIADDLVFPITPEHAICVEKASYPYLKGLEMDYAKQGLNAKFVFQNPNQSGQCGCGESFTVNED